MKKVIISEIIKSNVVDSSLIGGIKWFGVPISATAAFDDALTQQAGIGIGPAERLWIKKPNSIVNISIGTILGYSDVLDTGESFNIYTYLGGLLNIEGMVFPGENEAVLSSIQVNFNAGQTMQAEFGHVIYAPNDNLMEWFDTHSSEGNVPTGTGDEMSAVDTGECGLYVNGAFLEGVSTLSIRADISMTPYETVHKKIGYFPRLPVEVELSFSMYNDYVVENQSIFRTLDNVQSCSIWKMDLVKPRLISSGQSNSTGSFREWNFRMLAKNLIKN